MSPAMNNATMTLTSEVENILETLCGLMDRETAAVQNADFEIFKSLQSDKISLLGRYRSLMDTLQRQVPNLKQAGDGVTSRLKTAATRFQDSADKNAKALERGRQSMQRILDRIVRATRDTVHSNRQTYTKNGASHNGNSGPLSIRIDEIS